MPKAALLIAISMLALALSLVSCANNAAAALGAGSPSKAAMVPNCFITMAINERDGQNIGEIAEIGYDRSALLTKTGNGNAQEIEKINSDIKQKVASRYQKFKAANATAQSWAEAKSYPFTSERYLQIVMTYAEYPSAQSDGEIFSYVYDKRQNIRISLESALLEQGFANAASFQKKAQELYCPPRGNPASKLGSAVAKGFLIPSNGGGPEILFEGVVLSGPDPPWKHFFALSVDKNEVRQLNSELLFMAGEMDKMDPPLFYQDAAVDVVTPGEQLYAPTK